ncbi:class I adenylate-forming enzyme family protein [Caballeronia sp. BR00000012568055]|uniref:class I adenylate-forming enzyme family protein n=1 Tax=Caballeronia sp. BR00000012568055 TaxID=2918761 RepID=UPI0023F69C5B|nr:AMP-binding protein [Caballeronia sp. BR00000012568055]
MMKPTYIDVLLDELQAHGAQPVLRYRNTTISGDTLRRLIYCYARALSSLGIGRGALVALFAPNHPDALAVRYAANLLGAAAMYLPAPAMADRRAALLERISPTLLVVFGETAHLVPRTVNVRTVYIGKSEGAPRLDHLAAIQPDTPIACRAHADDLAVIASSGGTTGVPKGSRRSFARYTALVSGPRCDGMRRLINGPLAYLSQVLVDATLIGGGSIVLQSRYDAALTLAAIEAERITDLFLAEPQLFDLMDYADARTRDVSSLRAITHIGGDAPAILRRRAIERFGPILTHTYGASEAGLVSMLKPSDYVHNVRLLDTAGRVRAGVEVRIRRVGGTLARVREHGLIEVKSAAVAQGYYHQPLESAHKFSDGWCMTGDVGLIDEQGFLHVLGRAADVVEIGGRVIGPVQIEEVLCGLADVRYAVAFASRTGIGALTWNVAVEPWGDRRVDLGRCRRAVDAAFGGLVSGAMRIISMKRVPLTEQGKIDRNAVEERVRDAYRSDDRTPENAPLALLIA